MTNFIKYVVSGKHTTYEPKFPEKYGGEFPIIARSQWEIAFMRWCDFNPSILNWASETIVVPYYDPIKKKNRRYYPDFQLKIKDKAGNVKIYMVEIKPHKEVILPKRGKKAEKTRIYESSTFITNKAKWAAAEDFCKKHGWYFRIITEKELFKGQ